MPKSPYIPLQRDDKQTQIQRLLSLLERNKSRNIDLWAGYEYIRANIAGNNAWDQKLLEWLSTAAEINGPGQPFMKQFVFGMNDEAALRYQGRHISLSENQRVSDNLARQVISDYIHALRKDIVLTPQQIFMVDVGSAVEGLHLPRYAWAGGPLGTLFGFDIDYIYPDLVTKTNRGLDWLNNADKVYRQILMNDPYAVANEAAKTLLEKTLNALVKRFRGITLYTSDRRDPLSAGTESFAYNSGFVNATYTYFKTGIPQRFGVEVLNDDGSPTGPSVYKTTYVVGPTIEIQMSTPRGTSTLTSDDWASGGDEASFTLSGGDTTVKVKTSAKDGAAAQKVVSLTVSGRDITNNVAIAANVAGLLGNSLTRFVAGSDPLVETAAGTVIQAIGLNISQAIAQGGIARDITYQLENGVSKTVRNDVLSNFGQEVATAFKNAAIGSFSALLTTELGRTLGLNGFGAELFNTAAGTGASAVIGKVVENIGTAGAQLFDGISLSKVFAAGVPDVLSGALGSFFGAKLGSLVISPTNTEGAILSSVGSAAGAWATSAAGAKLLGGTFQVISKLGVFGGPFVGAFVGFVLGALVGKLFGKKKPRVPTANAAVNLDLASGYFTLGSASTANGGNRDLVVNMATGARDILNGLIGVVVGGVDVAPNANSSGNLPSQSYGHTGNQVWVNYRQQGQRNVADATQAVEYGVLRAIKDTRIMGGDLLIKRALLSSQSTSSVALTGDIQVAADYRTYLENRRNINQLIQAAPTSSLAATWLTVLARAADLNLHKFNVSDFYGGMAGFANSFGYGEGDLAYETLVVTSEGSAVRIATNNGTAPFEMLAGSNNIADPIAAARSVLISDFGINVGYKQWSGQATAGNDIWIASGGPAVTMDDLTEQEEWYWNPQDQAWDVRYKTLTGGDDIFVGSDNDDTLNGRAGWDWLDGGAGQDVIYGGSQDDVLLGRAGVDSLYGEDGNDYLAGGDGDDHPAHSGSPYNGGLWGGEGNDVLVGGGGTDAMWGENGDDLFIVEQDGGNTWDYHHGGAGSDTVSFERFNGRLSFDLNSNAGNGYTAVTYGDGYVSIENVTGTRYNDVLAGDGGANVLRGLSGDDSLYGREGDDTLEGGQGADTISGGWGNDTASYANSSGGVSVSLRSLGTEFDPVFYASYYSDLTPMANDHDWLRWHYDNYGRYEGRKPNAIFDTSYYLSNNSDVAASGHNPLDHYRDFGIHEGRDPNGEKAENSAAITFDPNFYASYYPDLAFMANDHQRLREHYDRYGRYEGRKPNPTFDTSYYLSSNADVAAAGINPLDHYYYFGVHEGRAPRPNQSVNTEASGGDAGGDSLLSIENLTGSAFADELAGNSGDNQLLGLKGDDTFILTTGNDTIDGGDGLDSLDAKSANNALTLYYSFDSTASWIATTGGGTTSLSSIERFVGTRFGDTMSGSAADEVFDGGAGNDYLSGEGGSDMFVFGRGDGQDIVYASNTGSSAILLKDGLNWRDVKISGANFNQQSGDLTVEIRGTSDKVTVGGNFSYVNTGTSAGEHNHAIKSLNLGSLSALDIDMIDWTPEADSEAGTTVYGAQNRSDLIFANSGNDFIYTSSGVFETRGNVVYAGDGDDTIAASTGDDQYIFERGNGADTLYDDGGADTIVMGPSVTADDVIYEVVAANNSADLYIGIRDPNDPNKVASQVSDRIRVVGGGMKYIGVNYGNERINTVEYVRVGGQELDLTKANINWVIGYESDGGGGDDGGGPNYYTPPLAIDLDGDGVELRSVEGSRIASIEADGTVTRMGWLGQDDGFLALDRDGNGVIDRIGEISFANDVKGARTDLEGLAAYDSNGDNKLDASDARWSEFKVWQDKNQDGYGSKNELVSLDKAGITFINLKGRLTGFSGKGTDGFDNTVIATTEIGWSDKTRTGSGYDVLLARLQVRTDSGLKDLASADALARGVKADDLEAVLHGVQSLTEEQVKALREKKAQGSKATNEAGLLYRIEDLLGTSTKLVGGATAKVVNGLLSVDASLVQKIVAGSRALGLVDRYVESDWTKLGSAVRGKAEKNDILAVPKKRDLSSELSAIIEEARGIASARDLADGAKAAARATADAADAASQLAPPPPSREEMEKYKSTDKFKLLEFASGGKIEAAVDVLDRPGQQLRTMPPSGTNQQASSSNTEDVGRTPPAADPKNSSEAQSADAGQPVADYASTQQAAARQDRDALDVPTYGVEVRTANARLVQALASFGDAPSMMVSYQGLNVADDPQAAWLSVNAMPSVQRLAAVR